jgi:hypothetical protein
MLRIILLVVISISSSNVFADSFFVKYNDLVESSIITEEFKNIDDFSNRIEELNYINGQSIKILNLGNNISIRTKNQTVDRVKIGGEGGGS